MTCRLLFALVACVTSERVFSARTFQNAESEVEAGFARLRVNTVDKVRVEAISREESIRMRQSGLRFHEVEHHHFADRSSKNGKLWQDLKQAAKEQASRDFPWEEEPDPSSPPAARASGGRALRRQNAMDRKNTSIATDLQKVLLPQQQIRPTRVAGYLCAQFDLDLFLLSGGIFPGLLGIGLLGDIHYQPATKCFGWTAELYLMLSIGFSVFGMDFRVAVVVIATLVVTERPLAAGSKDLVWELPEGFDTTHCHNKNPFSLISSTSREGWGFIYTHILSNQYLQHAEVEVQRYLDKNKDDINNFKRYLDLIEPPRALPTKVVSASQSQGLAKEGIMGSVQVTGRWGEDGLKLEVTLPKDLRVKSDSVSANIMQFTRFVRATIWQDLGDALLSQRSDDCLSPPKHGYHCSFLLPARRGARAFVQLTIAAFQDFSVPMQLDPSEETFQFPASFRAARNPQDGTLSCQKLTVSLPDVTGQCINHVDIKEVQLQVQVSSVQAVATWTPQEFGEKAPWGINVPQSRYEKDNEEIHKALADSSAHGVLVRVSSLQNFQIMRLLQQAPAELGAKRSQSFREEKWTMLQRPSPEAADFLATKGLHPLILQSLMQLKLALQQELNDATKDRPISAQVLETLQVSAAVKDIVTAVNSRCSFGELACPEVALRAALNQPERPTALVHGLRACTLNSNKFYYLRNSATAAERVTSIVFPGGNINAENITKQLEEMFPKSKHTGESSKWVNYGSRTVRSDSCLSIGFLGAGSPEECQSGCDRVEDKACNTAVFEEEDGWCSLWKCSPWDSFPRQPGKVLSIRTDVPPDLNISHGDLVAFAGLPDWALDRAANIIIKGAIARQALLTAMTKVPNLQVSWSKALTEKVWKSPNLWPTNEVVAEGSYRRLLVNVLLEDASWVKSEAAQQTLQSFIGQMANGDGVMVGVSTGQLVGDGAARQFFTLKNDFGGHAGNRWTQGNELVLRGCKVHVNTSWVWQVPSAAAYFIRPSMVPVAQSLFAAYDQFVSKLPNYGAQVLQRLVAKEDSFWKASVLPYDSTDGRHLHRHMKKGEADRVKVYKGEVATDDAVYNFPKAIKESKYRDSQNFMYNVGLSAANLFLRVVSDVQAMFHLYFADHPDWDGACESLPAQFNLLYEWETARVPSNWVKSRLDTKRRDMSVKPMYRAGRTVSEQGARLTADGEAMIKNWHWVSKPRWFNKEDSRAEFFTQTPPAHGKDGWATPDASQLNAVMWPHVWCELIQQEWSTAAAAKKEEPLTRSGKSVRSSLDDLQSLTKAVPAEVGDILHKAGFDQDKKTLQSMFHMPLSGRHGGCPVRMVAREMSAADTHAQSIVIAWGAMLKISNNILEFYRTVLAELTDDLEQVELDGSNQGDDADEDVPTAAPTNETQPDANSIGASRTAQLETLMDTISIAPERWKTEGVNEKGLHRNLLTMWSALFKNMTEADTHAVVDARRSFQEARDKLHALAIAQEARVLQIGQHLDRLLPSASEEAADDNVTDSANASNASKTEVKDYSNLKFAIRFATVLTATTAERQKEAVSLFNKIFNCIDVVARPEELPDTALNQWAEDSAGLDYRLNDVRNLIWAFSADEHDGVELFFEEACSVPPNTNFATPDHERFDHLREPRPECERVVLSNAMMSIFPNFAARVMYQYSLIQQTLKDLAKVPTKALMQYMVSTVEGYVRHLSQGAKSMLMDNDFYKAFSYRKDGSLVGRLWSNLPSALSEIAATLQNRQEGRKQWITESIAYRSKLKTARRGRVRELEKNKTRIPSEEEGCVCEEKWSAYEWTDDTFPRSVTNEGCVKPEGHRWLFSKGNSSGVCKAKQDSVSFEKCKSKYAACDPEASPVRPQFQIWRSADVLHADPVRLPLLQLDLYMHVDIRNRRADFCTPNFAPIMLDTNWHWSTSSWLPYDLRRSVCFGARIHPPGVSLAVTRCEHKGMGIKRSSKSTEWSLTGVAYLISHYNVWGTGDGDMTHSWFAGGDNWGSKAMSTGWPNFLAADPGTWASSSAGSGYLQTGNLMSSPSTFWFSLVAEVLSALSLSEAVNDENTTGDRQGGDGVSSHDHLEVATALCRDSFALGPHGFSRDRAQDLWRYWAQELGNLTVPQRARRGPQFQDGDAVDQERAGFEELDWRSQLGSDEGHLPDVGKRRSACQEGLERLPEHLLGLRTGRSQLESGDADYPGQDLHADRSSGW